MNFILKKERTNNSLFFLFENILYLCIYENYIP